MEEFLMDHAKEEIHSLQPRGNCSLQAILLHWRRILATKNTDLEES